jgi:hypothetical protein
MKILAGILAVLLLLGLGACRKTDIRTVVIQVPGMKNAACAKIVQDAFLRQPTGAILSIRPDTQKRELTVTYNSMVVAHKNLEATIASAGFDAFTVIAPGVVNDGTTAHSNAVAALPPECR